VTSLGSATYYGCINLQNFTVPAQMTDLGALNFMGCASLTAYDVEEGNTVYTVEDGVLYTDNMTTLYSYPSGKQDASFSIPEGVVTIFDGAFFAAQQLTEITFPSTLQVIGAGAFEYCTGLTQLTLPEGLMTIYDNAFADCSSLQSVVLPESLTGVGSYAFYACPELSEVTIPESCTTVGDYAFGYTDGTETDDDGNPIPVAVEGFVQHGGSGSVDVWLIVRIIVLVLALAAVILLLIRVIRKNQMSAEEQAAVAESEGLKKPLTEEDEKYVSILDSIQTDEDKASADTANDDKTDDDEDVRSSQE
jgi:hypothetical protein